MRRALLILLLLGAPAAARAEQVEYPIETLVQMSDIIVVGTLRDVKEHTADDVDYGRGRIVVREVIWGDVSPGDALLLKWQNGSGVICPRVDHDGNADEEGVWLLTRDDDAVRADNPGRFVKLSERRKVEQALARSPVVLRSDRYRVSGNDAVVFTVVYRNVSSFPREFPGVASDEVGQPLFTSGAKLSVGTLRNGKRRRVELARRFASARALAPVTLGPRDERRFDVDLRLLLGEGLAEGYSYGLTLQLPGLPRTNELGFYFGEVASLGPTPAAPPPAPGVNYSRRFAARAPRAGGSPLARAALAALAALLLFPLFRKLRSSLVAARLARV